MSYIKITYKAFKNNSDIKITYRAYTKNNSDKKLMKRAYIKIIVIGK